MNHVTAKAVLPHKNRFRFLTTILTLCKSLTVLGKEKSLKETHQGFLSL